MDLNEEVNLKVLTKIEIKFYSNKSGLGMKNDIGTFLVEKFILMLHPKYIKEAVEKSLKRLTQM